jgi:hypothetical protein
VVARVADLREPTASRAIAAEIAAAGWSAVFLGPATLDPLGAVRAATATGLRPVPVLAGLPTELRGLVRWMSAVVHQGVDLAGVMLVGNPDDLMSLGVTPNGRLA